MLTNFEKIFAEFAPFPPAYFLISLHLYCESSKGKSLFLTIISKQTQLTNPIILFCIYFIRIELLNK